MSGIIWKVGEIYTYEEKKYPSLDVLGPTKAIGIFPQYVFWISLHVVFVGSFLK